MRIDGFLVTDGPVGIEPRVFRGERSVRVRLGDNSGLTLLSSPIDPWALIGDITEAAQWAGIDKPKEAASEDHA